MSKRAFLVRLSEADNALLDALGLRLRCTDADLVRFAIRWYALSGPWRGPEEPTLKPLFGLEASTDVGPQFPRKEIA